MTSVKDKMTGAPDASEATTPGLGAVEEQAIHMLDRLIRKADIIVISGRIPSLVPHVVEGAVEVHGSEGLSAIVPRARLAELDQNAVAYGGVLSHATPDAAGGAVALAHHLFAAGARSPIAGRG